MRGSYAVNVQLCVPALALFRHHYQRTTSRGQDLGLPDLLARTLAVSHADRAAVAASPGSGFAGKVSQPGAQCGGVRMVEPVEDGQCLRPGSACGGEIAGRDAGLAEPGQTRRGVLEMSQLQAKVGCLPVAVRRLGEGTKVMVNLAEAVQGRSLRGAVAHGAAQFDAFSAALARFVVFAQLCVTPADDIQGDALTGQVTGTPTQLECELAMLQCVLVLAAHRVHMCDRGVGKRLLRFVAKLTLHFEAPGQLLEPFLMLAELD